MDGVLRLRDGRELAWGEAGDPSGTPVLAFHGTPGSRYQLLIDDTPIREAGVRWIVPDRPGFGKSTWQPDRTLVGWPDDVAQLADHLDLERFAVLGMSGGGPHAAVCARGLPERVTAAAIVSGIGPVDRPGSEAGMMPVNRLFTRVARKAPAVNRAPFGLMAVLGRRFPERLLTGMAKSAPAADAALLARDDVVQAFLKDLRGAPKTAGRAAAQDFQLFSRDWGFCLEDITVPVDVWQGDADVNVPPAHARAQAAAIPGAVLHVWPGGGHFAMAEHLDEVLEALLARGR